MKARREARAAALREVCFVFDDLRDSAWFLNYLLNYFFVVFELFVELF